MKRGSITTYFVVGISIIIVIGLFFLYDNSNKNNQLLIDTEGSASLESEQNLLDSTIKFCVKQTLIEAELEYGLSKVFSTNKIEEYMNNNLASCLGDFDQFDKLGYDVKRGTVSSNIEITNEAIVAQINYPLTFSRKGVQIKFDKQTFRFSRIVSEKISFEKSTRIVSADGSTIIEIEPGTKVTLDGLAIDEIGIKLLDRGFNGQSNSVLAGNMAYTGIPHGAEFSKPIKITHFYKDKDIHPTIEEDTLRMGYYDDDLGVWVGIPAKVDPVKNRIEIETTHFSPYGVVLRCGTQNTNKVTIITPTLIQEKCGCNSESWKNSVEDSSDSEANGDQDYSGDYLGKCFEEYDEVELYVSTENPEELNIIEKDLLDDTVPQCIPLILDTEKEECEITPIEDATTDANEDVDSEDAATETDGTDTDEDADTELKYYGYEKITNLVGKTDFTIKFEGYGDACIALESFTVLIDDTDGNEEGDDEETYNVESSESEINEDQTIIIECLDVSTDDICDIKPLGDKENFELVENENNVELTFEYNLINNENPTDEQEPPNELTIDACLNGKAKITINGFGIDAEKSYISCTKGIAEDEKKQFQYVSSVNGEIEGVCSVCQKEDQDDDDTSNDYYAWVPTDEEKCNEVTTDEDLCTRYQLDLRDDGCFVCDGEESISWIKDESNPNLCSINQCTYTKQKT